MLLIVTVGLFFGNSPNTTRSGVLAYATEMSSSQLLSSTNAQRTAVGAGSLAINSALTSAAQTKANDMAARNYWSHNTPDGQAPWYFINNAGYKYLKAGENLAYGFSTSADTITGWMNSPAHKDNMLDTSYTEVGFGFVDSPDYNSNGQETIVVAMYGQPQVAAATTTAPAKPAATPATPTPAAQTPAPSSAAEAAPTSSGTEAATAGGAAAPAPSSKEPVTTETAIAREPTTQSVSKLQTLAGGKLPWITLAVGIFSGVAVLFMAIKHSLAFKRVLIHGEQFILHHPMLDIALTGLVMTGYVLSQTTGFIK